MNEVEAKRAKKDKKISATNEHEMNTKSLFLTLMIALFPTLLLLFVNICVHSWLKFLMIARPDSVEVFDHHQVTASLRVQREEQPSPVRRDRQAGDAAGQDAVKSRATVFSIPVEILKNFWMVD